MRKKRITLTILGVCYLLVLAVSAYADSVAYNLSVSIQKQTQNYTIIHSHNWKRSFGNGKFEIVSKKDGATIFEKKVGAFTHIAASEKHDVIVLLSNVMFLNPYQLRIFTFSGEEIKKDSVSQNSIGNKYGDVAETTTNLVHWFNERDPGFEFVEAEDELYLKMNDINYRCRGIMEMAKDPIFFGFEESDPELEFMVKNCKEIPRFSIKIKYGLNGQYDQAIADYNKDIEINPRDAVAYYNRGIVYGLSGQYDQAIADYTKAIELNPKDSDSYYNRGNAYETNRNMKMACSDWRKACKSGNCSNWGIKTKIRCFLK